MHCRASWGNSFVWAAVVAFGIVGAAIAEGANASPNRRSRSADPSIAHPNPLNSRQKDDVGDLSQCTNYDYSGKATPAELEAPQPYAAPQAALTSNPSTPSPSSGLQVASPYASTPLFSPSLAQPTASPVTPAATAPAAVQMPPPSTSEPPPLPSGTSVPVTMLSPTPGMSPTPVGSTGVGSTAAKPAALTTSPAVPSSPATASPSTTPVIDEPAVPSRPVTSAPAESPSTASPSSPPTLDAPAASSLTPAAPGTSDSTSSNAPASPLSPAAPIAAFPSVNAPSGPTGAMSSPNANSNASPSQLQFAPIPFGFQPLVTAQATFQAIPASSLTLLQVAEVASDLQQVLANVASGSVPVTAVVTPINVEAAAAAPLPGRRHLLQAGNTLQATVLFTAEFATAPGSNTDVQAAVQAAVATAVAPLIVTTSATSIGPGSYDVEIVFPANNQVSSSASQGTLAATTFLAGLRSSPTTQLAGLAASAGSFTVASSEIQNELVTLSPGLVSPAASSAIPLPLPLPTPDATSAPTSPAASAVMSPSLPAGAPPVAEPTPSAASEPVPTSTADATAAPAGPTPTQATSPAGNVSPVLGTPPGASQSPPPLTPPTPDAVQPSPPSPTVAAVTASPPREPTSAATAAPTTEPPAASPISTPNPAEAAPQATPLPPLLTMNLFVAFPPTATAAAQDLANMLYNQSQRDLYAVVDRNGPISFSNVVYGSQAIPTPILSLAPVPAPGPGPETSTAALPAAAAPESAPSAAAVESYSGSDADDSSSAASGQLYAINMQYGVGGARTNAVANLLVFSLNSSGPPRATDFAVQLDDPAQTGNVSVLSTYSSPSDYLIRVDCPEGYTGPVTVGYASPMIQAVNYNVINSVLLVKVTASTGTQQ